MGRYLGGFLRSENSRNYFKKIDIPPEEVFNTNYGSYIITGKTKGECTINE